MRLRNPQLFLVLATAYFLAGSFGSSLATPGKVVSLLMPATGIATAALAFYGLRFWPAIFIGSFLVNTSYLGIQPERLAASLSIAGGNSLEALTAAWFLNRAGGMLAYREPRNLLKFAVLSGMLSTLISAFIGSVSLYLGGIVRGDRLGIIAFNWWVADSMSTWILTPLLVLAAASFPWRLPGKRRLATAALLAIAIAMVYLAVFWSLVPGTGRLYLLGFLGIPLLLAVALNFGSLGVSVAVFGASVIAIWGTIESRGPFSPENPELTLLLLQLYLGTLFMTKLVLASVVEKHKRAQMDLDSRQKKLDTIIRSVPGIIFEYRPREIRSGQPNFISPFLTTMLGYTPEEWNSREDFWLDVVHPEDRERAATASDIALKDGKGAISNIRWVAKDGRTVYSEIRTVVMRESGESSMLGVIMDTTERVLAEQRLVETEAKLRYAQKMEAVGRLAGGVAHDFNNLLTSILGYCDLLMGQLEPKGPATTYANEIRRAAMRTADLTRKLLAFSRKDVTQPRPLNLNALLGEMEPELRGLLGGGISLELALQPDLHPVRADRDQMWLVIRNLVENARDAMPHGGRIALETSNTRAEDEADPGYFLKPAALECVSLTVRDQGTGIKREAMQHLFDPFFTTKSVTKGSGLGLSTVYAVLERSGGGIRVLSEPGAGSVFQAYLPSAGPAVPAESTDTYSRPVRGRELGRGKILIVENDPGFRRVLCDTLEKHDYAVLEAVDTDSALGWSRKEKEAISLLITDLALPGSQAIGLAESLLKAHPGLKVLFLAEFVAQAKLPRSLPQDRVLTIEKLFTPQRLLDVVGDLTGKPVPA
ncbi:MAG: hybrid sensor histidine kinase/response regulator [Fibrobacteres bacterium]|nr:hybrid sensor histidine kinase/response regulator [Fibrobacterota bacterium]